MVHRVIERYNEGCLESSAQRLNSSVVCELAAECGFALAGVSASCPVHDYSRFQSWVDRGLAGEMRYLTDHRATKRSHPESLLPGVRSVISVGMLYNGPEPHSTEFSNPERAWISRYAWGEDYHDVIRAKLEVLASKLLQVEEFKWRACVDTAPLLERSLARQAGLGWIGKNTCLINQQLGSWFFLGELLTTLEMASDFQAPACCGSCTRCIDACPTQAIVPVAQGE
ncbi:MAG: epoxyqueuosine reductase, partial [Bryobacterales bacterium]|nr:epoxyqueuosine reductase [Bryobacterales bacterium]